MGVLREEIVDFMLQLFGGRESARSLRVWGLKPVGDTTRDGD